MNISQTQRFQGVVPGYLLTNCARRCVSSDKPLFSGCQVPRSTLASSLHRRYYQISQICKAAATLEYGSLGDLGVAANTYVVLGLAHCFEKNEEGKLTNRMVIEPIAANSLECMVLGAKTCFKTAVGTTVEDALSKDKSMLPEDFQEATYCADFQMRCGASARTWQRPHAMDNLLDLVPLGQAKSNFNFNLDEKRVLNFENEVSDSDNIKQDMSIDVYGRQEEEAAAESKPLPPPKQQKEANSKEENEDDLDSLLDL